jgi:NADPH:quinone reductase-like Zn-dependent oxidoreductase
MHGPNDIKLEKILVPQPGLGQVLIKIECAPINQADIGII